MPVECGIFRWNVMPVARITLSVASYLMPAEDQMIFRGGLSKQILGTNGGEIMECGGGGFGELNQINVIDVIVVL